MIWSVILSMGQVLLPHGIICDGLVMLPSSLGTRTLFFFFHPIILFSNSFFDFPLFFEYVRSIEGLARDSVDVELTVYYRIYTGQKELENEDDRAEKAD